MTRINTNVGSLVAQNRLQQSNRDQNQALTRLSTGLRINKGSDDPAGLIASEALRSEITSLGKAISNTNRASQIISTADSALGEVSNLLNDIRGLVVEAANTGALSDEEISANQLQIDSSLEAVNRIAQTTTFQGRKLLDGSLDFETTAGSVDSIADINVDQASLGSTGSVDVDVVISAAAEQATTTAATSGFSAASNANVTTAAGINSFQIGTATDNVTIEGNFDSVEIVDGGASATSAVDLTDGKLTITVDDAATVTGASIATLLNAQAGVFATETGTLADVAAAAEADATAIDGAGIEITADTAGADFNNVQVQYVAGTDATTTAAYDADQKALTVTIGTGAGENNLESITAAIDGLADFSAEIVDGSGTALAGTNEGDNLEEYNEFTLDVADLPEADSTGTTGGEVITDSLVFQLNGSTGAETFNFAANTSIDQIAAAVNLVSDATGVTAESTDGEGLVFTSSGYGSDAEITIDVISEGAAGSFQDSFTSLSDTGSDIAATINGIEANGDGNSFSINTSTLDLSLTVDDGSSTNVSFQISGGGATFQLGSDVVSNQQARLGIGSVSTGKLGGTAGRLFELGTGQAKSLTNDVTGAAEVVDQVINKVTSLRGRLGAFQATTLDSNLNSLNETRANLQEAESSIRDADFAAESAALTRAQILVQSGTNVLSLANQQPQNVLSLIR